MKIVTGLFSPEDAVTAIRRLTKQGFNHDDFSMMSSAEEMPDYLEGEPEESATSGAAAGAAAGGAVGALGSVVASTIPGFESMFATGLMTTAVGGIIGGYLGSMYNVRAESQTKIDIHEALESGDILIVVRASEANANTAESVMNNSNGKHVEVHNIPAKEIEPEKAEQQHTPG